VPLLETRGRFPQARQVNRGPFGNLPEEKKLAGL
jgi:hypothetical protein